MGWLGIPFPEEDGGFGGGAHELAMLLRQAGRALVTEPLQANLALAGQLMARLAGPQQRASWLAPMIEGRIKLAFAFAERQARHEIRDCQTVARREGEGFVLSGRKVSVMGGAAADVFIVLARTSGDQYDTAGLSLFLGFTPGHGKTRGVAVRLNRRGFHLQSESLSSSFKFDRSRGIARALRRARANNCITRAKVEMSTGEVVGRSTTMKTCGVQHGRDCQHRCA